MNTDTLTKKQDKLYSDLVKEYDSNGWFKICDFAAFIQNKIKVCRDPFHYHNLTQVAEYAANDF